MIRFAYGVLLSASLFSPVLWAAGSAEMTGTDQQGQTVRVHVEMNAQQDLRAFLADKPDNYLLHSKGQTFHVVNLKGQPIAMTTQDVLRIAGSHMPSPGDVLRQVSQVSQVNALENTKQPVTVAGIEGIRYRLKYLDGQRQARTAELVLTRDPIAAELTLKVLALALSLSKEAKLDLPEGATTLFTRLQQENLGLLRFEKQFEVLRLDPVEPPASRFRLPSSSVQLPNLEQWLPKLGF